VSKKALKGLFVLCFLSTFIAIRGDELSQQSFVDEPASLGWIDHINDSANGYVNTHFDTYTSPVLGATHWRTVDLHVPLNGPDIEIARRIDTRDFFLPARVYTPSEIFNWKLDIARIELNYWGFPNQSALSNCNNHPGVKNVKVNIPGASEFDPIGMVDNGISYPGNTLTHFANNWLLLCEAFASRSQSLDENNQPLTPFLQNKIVLQSPDGKRYHFGAFAISDYLFKFSGIPKPWDVTLTQTLYVTDIEDRFGNWLTFDYQKVVLNDFATQLLLTKVRSKAGAEVTLSNDGTDITGLSYNNSTVTYTPEDKNWSYPPYEQRVLASVTTGNSNKNESWTYIYEEFGEPTDIGTYLHRGLTRIQNPWGGQTAFKYKARLFGCSANEAALPIYDYYMHQTTVSGKDIDTYNVTYDIWKDPKFNSDSTISEPIAFTDIQYPDRSEHYQYHCAHFVSQYTRDIRDYRLKQVETKNSAKNIIARTEYEWEEQAFDQPGADVWHDGNSGNRLVLSKVTIDDEYETQYSNFDPFGKPQLTSETQLIANKSRYTRHTFQNDTANWLIGFANSTSISADNNQFTEVESTTYHSDSQGKAALKDLMLPYEQQHFARWTQRFTDYFPDGNLKRIEYNAPRTVGSGNRFLSFADYHFGLAQSLTMPAPESAGTITSSRVINDDGLIRQITDFNGVTTDYLYDPLHRLIAVLPQHDITFNHQWRDTVYTWAQNSTGNITRKQQYCRWDVAQDENNETLPLTSVDTATCETDSIDFEITHTYDGLHRLTLQHQTDNSQHRYRRFAYNFRHQTAFQSYWSSNSNESRGLTQEFDEQTRLKTAITSGLGSIAYQYLPGNKVQVTNARGYQTTTEFLAYGSPDYRQPLLIESPEQVSTAFNIDHFGLIQSITQSGTSNANNTTASIQLQEQLYYDEFKQLCLSIRPDVGITAIKHNALGETIWQAQGVSLNQGEGEAIQCMNSAPANATHYTLNNHGALHSVTFADSSPNRQYRRDNNGNLLQLTAGQVTRDYQYNNLNLPESETLTIGTEKTFTLDYQYNALAHQTGITYPDNSEMRFAPNAFGEATQVKRYIDNTLDFTYAQRADYHPNGILHTFDYGNGLQHETTLHSLSNLPTGIEDASIGNVALHLQYQYDANANFSAILDQKNNQFSLNTLSYDGLDRLISTTGNSGIGNSSIGYDALGNITHYHSQARNLTYQYNYNLNRLTNITSTGEQAKPYTNFAYDNRGNVTHNSYHSFQYNQANQMIASGDHQYLYDGNNKRVKHTDSHGTTYSLYGLDGKLRYQETENGSINYIFLGNKLIAKDGNIPPSTSPVQHHRPYGSSIEGENNAPGYTGHHFDTTIGLSYMQARYYDPVIGRFYSNDPVGTLGHIQRGNPVHGFNRYAYVNNNPYKYVDPDGEFLHLAIGFAVGFAAEIGAQALQGKELNFTKASVSGFAGAVTGGVSAIAKTSLTVGGKIVANTAQRTAAGGLVVGSTATSAAGASAVNDSLSDTSAEQIVDNAIESAVEGVIPQGKIVGKVAGDIVSATGKKLDASESLIQGASNVASGTASNVFNDQCSATKNEC